MLAVDGIRSNINTEVDRARHVPRNRPLDICVSRSTHNLPTSIQHPHSTEKRRPTWGQIVFKAHANLALRVGDDREACLSVNVLIGEVDVSLGYGTDDADVGALAGDRTDVSGDDDECVWVGCVPYALFRLDFSWREGEFDSGGRGGR